MSRSARAILSATADAFASSQPLRLRHRKARARAPSRLIRTSFIARLLVVLSLPCAAIQSIDDTIVLTEAPQANGPEAQPFVKAVGTRVCCQRVEEHGLNMRVSEAFLKGQVHHACAEAAT